MYQLLIAGKNPEITDTVVRLLEGYEKIATQSANDLQTVEDLMKATVFDVVMNCGGFSAKEERMLEEVSKKYHNSKVIEHFGGGSGLLLSELKQTLNI